MMAPPATPLLRPNHPRGTFPGWLDRGHGGKYALAPGVARGEEGRHVEGGLFRLVAVSGADRTGTPGPAGEPHAVLAPGSRQMRGTGGHVIAVPAEGIDRTAGEAGLVGAILARAGARRERWRRCEVPAKGQRPPQPPPEAVFRVNIDADRRAEAPAGAAQPALEWTMGTGPRKMRDGASPASHQESRPAASGPPWAT